MGVPTRRTEVPEIAFDMVLDMAERLLPGVA